jgi:mxaJ protein
MSSRCLSVAAALAVLASPGTAREIRVCADPDNLPFSHRDGSGFENKLMRIIGRELGADVAFVWQPQWRGFVRKTLLAGTCDIIPGIAAGSERVRTTQPYFVSSYVFVTRRDRAPVRSFKDLLTTDGRIGVQLIGDDGTNTPPVEELAARGLSKRLKGYMVWGRTTTSTPPLEEIMHAVAAGEIDVAVVWGPPAGYFATREHVPLTLSTIAAGEQTVVPMSFAIAMGVRKQDEALAQALNTALTRHATEIRALLDGYGVPRAEPASPGGAR